MLLPYAKYSTAIAQLEIPTEPAASWRYLSYTLTGLQRQATVLSELRSRASILLSGTGIIAGLLGPRALKDGHPRGFVWLGLGFLAAGILMCIAVLRAVHDGGTFEGSLLRRKRRWKVSLSQPEISKLARVGEDRAVPPQILYDLTTARDVNHATVGRRSLCLTLAGLLLFAQIVSWAITLAP